jgi:hypothetical protein
MPYMSSNWKSLGSSKYLGDGYQGRKFKLNNLWNMHDQAKIGKNILTELHKVTMVTE